MRLRRWVGWGLGGRCEGLDQDMVGTGHGVWCLVGMDGWWCWVFGFGLMGLRIGEFD